MDSFDIFTNALLEEAKRFGEKAKESSDDAAKKAFQHAALLLIISSLEAFINGITEDLKDGVALNNHEKAFLTEQNIELVRGEFTINNRLKMSRLLDRVEFLIKKFTNKEVDRSSTWWLNLKSGIKMRNHLVHPKEQVELTDQRIDKIIMATIFCIDKVFKAIYKKGLPALGKGLNSELSF